MCVYMHVWEWHDTFWIILCWTGIVRSCADRFLLEVKQSSEADKEISSLLAVADLTNGDLPTLLSLLRSEERGRQCISQDSEVGEFVVVVTSCCLVCVCVCVYFFIIYFFSKFLIYF